MCWVSGCIEFLAITGQFESLGCVDVCVCFKSTHTCSWIRRNGRNALGIKWMNGGRTSTYSVDWRKHSHLMSCMHVTRDRQLRTIPPSLLPLCAKTRVQCCFQSLCKISLAHCKRGFAWLLLSTMRKVVGLHVYVGIVLPASLGSTLLWGLSRKRGYQCFLPMPAHTGGKLIGEKTFKDLVFL